MTSLMDKCDRGIDDLFMDMAEEVKPDRFDVRMYSSRHHITEFAA